MTLTPHKTFNSNGYMGPSSCVMYINVSISIHRTQWRTQQFCSGGGGSTNSVEDRENGDLGAVAPSQGFRRQL